MPQFSVSLIPGWDNDIKKVRLPDADKRSIQRAFKQAVQKSYKNSYTEAIKDSRIYFDLINGVIAAIFGFTQAQLADAINKFTHLAQNSSETLIGTPEHGFKVERIISDDQIDELSVTHIHSSASKGGFPARQSEITIFKWLRIIMDGLPADHPIMAAIKTLIPLEPYVPHYSSASAVRNSRSNLAIMVKLKDTNQIFSIIPQGNILEDITKRMQPSFIKMLRADFQERLNNLGY